MRILIILICLPFTNCLAQKDTSSVKLLSWSTEDCDNTYDPSRLVDRITSFESVNGITSFTVNFSENCCASFEPTITVEDNKLMIIPYEELMIHCGCMCCFSINFEVEGIDYQKFEIYFKSKKIELSDDHYKTQEPTYDFYQGKKINRVNKYGFQEGLWIDSLYNGAVWMMEFPETSLYYEPNTIWKKSYSESGKLLSYFRGDTSESWFEDGELRFQEFIYSSGDTTFERSIRKYNNRQLKERYLQRRYPVVIKSEFDSTYKGKGTNWDYVYKEEYYQNGQQKYLYGKDTSYTWFENGVIKIKDYKKGKLEYNEKGKLIKKIISWKEPGRKGRRDLSHSLYVDYCKNGNIEQIHFVRDELTDNGYAPSIHYYWKWNKMFKLIESPKKWDEAFPWKKVEGIKLLQLPTN